MSNSAQFACTACHKPFNGKVCILPPGWEWQGSKLLCDDCCSTSSLIGDRARKAVPLPLGATSPTAIQLSSGAYFDFANPDFGVIAPCDIAAGLRQIPIAQQNARRAQLDHIRTTRPLTRAEASEQERLEHAFYMRNWRASFQENSGIPYDKFRENRAARRVAS